MFPARLPSLVEHNDARRNSCPITTDGYAHTHSQRALKKEKTVTRGEERFMFAGRDEKKKGAHCSSSPQRRIALGIENESYTRGCPRCGSANTKGKKREACR